MRSRWDDAEANTLSELDRLVYASRLIGAETSLVVWGGGNTSIKTVERGSTAAAIFPSSASRQRSDLKSIQRKDFPALRIGTTSWPSATARTWAIPEMVDYLAHGLVGRGGSRHAIENSAPHGFVGGRAVVHTLRRRHVSLTNNDRGGTS